MTVLAEMICNLRVFRKFHRKVSSSFCYSVHHSPRNTMFQEKKRIFHRSISCCLARTGEFDESMFSDWHFTRWPQFVLFMQITTFSTYKTKPYLQVKAKKTVCITSKLLLFSIFLLWLAWLKVTAASRSPQNTVKNQKFCGQNQPPNN